MRKCLVAVLMVMLAGCGVEVLTTTATVGKLQADNAKAIQGHVAHISESSAKTNTQRAIDTFAAEKGRYPTSLDELVPAYFQSVPTHASGSPFGYDLATGKLLDTPGVIPSGPTSGDFEKMKQIRAAIDQYGRAVGYYPPSLAALAPSYLNVVPKADSSEDFLYYPQDGGLFHPAQVAQATPPSPGAAPPSRPPAVAPRAARSVPVSGSGPMGEVMTGISIQNQLNSNSNAGSSAAGGHMRQSIGGATQRHNQQQEKALKELGY